MGRVDSALRRAAGEPPTGSVITEQEQPARPAASGGGAAAELSRPAERALLAHVNPNLAQKVVADDKIDPASREQYRRLAAALHQGHAATGLSVVMVASAVAGEGKTLTASNLALTLSGSYQQRVLLIDADLRRPSLHTVFKTPRSPGLTDALVSTDDTGSQVQTISPYLTLLPAGKLRVDPIAGLTSARMRHIVEAARATYSWVIIDTPPVGVLTDASLLASMVDGAILVVKAQATPYDLVKRAVEAIGAEKVLGVVLNRAMLRAHRYSYGYGDYHKYLTAEPTEEEPTAGR
jgi:protein-tyrosine kinase